jgi:hypothetical protein
VVNYPLEVIDGFTFMRPRQISCNITTCQHYEKCLAIGKTESILPIANSILEQFGLDWQLPGHGQKYDDCGTWRARGCPHSEAHNQSLDEDVSGKIYVEFYHRSCNRAECPVCYEKWAGLGAKKINHKLTHLWKFGKVCHFTVSPSEKDVLNLPYPKLREKAYRIAKSRGIKGGSVIWHPFREHDDGTWYFSPHFHIIGFGWVQNSAELYKKDGCIVKKILDGKKERSVFKTAMYQLSHCGIDVHGKHNPVSWFGVASSAGKNRPKIPEMEREKHLCPGCGEELIQLRYFGDPDNLPFSWSQKLEKKPGGWWLDPEDWVEVATKKYGGEY